MVIWAKETEVKSDEGDQKSVYIFITEPIRFIDG